MSGDKETDAAAVDEAETRREAPEQGDEQGNDAAPEAAAEADPEALKSQLQEARRTADSHWDTVLRTRAELENLRKRTERELENAHKYGLERFLLELLPVKDSLELGLAADAGDNAGTEKLREGMELTLKKFSQALEKFGVTELNPEGEEFNPEFHEAMTMQEAEGRASNTVVSVIQKGYLLNGRLVRPALVIVAK